MPNMVFELHSRGPGLDCDGVARYRDRVFNRHHLLAVPDKACPVRCRRMQGGTTQYEFTRVLGEFSLMMRVFLIPKKSAPRIQLCQRFRSGTDKPCLEQFICRTT